VALNREAFLARTGKANGVVVPLADGRVVLLRPATAKVYRDYKRSLRDKDGLPIPEKQAYGDELLIAALMIDSHGNMLLTEADVMAGALDNHDMADLVPIIRKAYEMIGLADKTDEDREKNLPATPSTEPSSE
jgi:hypothetical protein